MADKITIREGFERARAVFEERGDAEMVAFFEGRLEQVEKRNTAERKPTAKQIENEGFAAAIVEWMEPDHLYAIPEIAKNCPVLVAANISAARVAPMMTKLAAAGKVIRTEDKRKVYYSLA